jgi:acid phosphatase
MRSFRDYLSELGLQKLPHSKQELSSISLKITLLCTVSKMYYAILATLGLAVPIAHGLTPLQTFYPPNLDDTAYITNTTLGTYGGIYQAPTRQANTSAPYGSYDYCTMPHPRVQEYSLPGPVKNGSVKANIIYLEYLQRHQRRTPYNILPGGEVLPLILGITRHS